MDMEANSVSSHGTSENFEEDNRGCSGKIKQEKLARYHRCGCGKTYLSYSALYTHIKFKHDGHEPDGTRAQHIKNEKRGRHLNAPDSRASNDDCFFEVDFLEERGFFKGASDPVLGFELSEESKDVCVLYNKIVFWSQAPSQSSNQLVCDDILSLYLIDVAKITPLHIYKTFVILVENLRRCLNTLGWRLPGEKRPSNSDYCSFKGAQNVPEICDEFVNHYLPLHCSTISRTVAVHMVLHLCNWLYTNHFTQLRLSLIKH
jgi:hypothetical protein